MKKKNFRKMGLSTAAVLIASAGIVPTVSATAGIIHTVTFADLKGAASFKTIEIGFPDFTIHSILDSSKIVIDGVATVNNAVIGTGGNLEVDVNNIDPSQDEYTLRILPGALRFNGYQQMADITVKFRPHDILPDFNDLFLNDNPSRANDIFSRNQTNEINLLVTGSYIRDIKAVTRLVSNIAHSTAEIIVETNEGAEFVTVSINGELRRVVQKEGDVFRAAIQGVQQNDDVRVTAFNSSGTILETQTALLRENSTNFTRVDQAFDFGEKSITVREYLEGTESIETFLQSGRQIQVSYTHVPYIRYAGNAQELARALADLDRWRAQGASVNERAIIRLTDDITNISAQEIQFLNRNLVIESADQNVIRTISGVFPGTKFKFGDGSDMDVLIKNVEFNGNVEVNINTGDSNFNSVTVNGTTTIKSAGSTSVYLNDFITNKLVVNNHQAVRVVAGENTNITNTEINNNNSDARLIQMDGGKFNTITKTGTAGTGLIILEGNTPFTTVVTEGTSGTNLLQLESGVTLNSLVAKRPTTITPLSSGTITNVNTSQLSSGVVTYPSTVTIGNSDDSKLRRDDEPGGDSTSTSATIAGVSSKAGTLSLSSISYELSTTSQHSGTIHYKVFTSGTPNIETKAQVIAASSQVDSNFVTVTSEGKITIPITNLTKNTEYDIYFYSQADDNDSIAVKRTFKTNNSSIIAGGSIINNPPTMRDIQNGGRTLTLTLSGTNVNWKEDVVTREVQANAIAQLLGVAGSTHYNGVLKPNHITLSSDKKTLTIYLPGLPTFSGTGTFTINAPQNGLLSFNNDNDLSLASSNDDKVMPTVRNDSPYRSSVEITAVANLGNVTLKMDDVIPSSGTNVSATLSGLTSDMEYNLGGTNWYQGSSGDISVEVRSGQKITVQDSNTPSVSRVFEIEPGAAYATDTASLREIFTAINVNDNGLRKVYLAPGNYSLTPDAVSINSGRDVTFVTFEDGAITGAEILFNDAQQLGRISFGNNVRGMSMGMFTTRVDQSNGSRTLTFTINAIAQSGTYKVYKDPSSTSPDALIATIEHTKGTATSRHFSNKIGSGAGQINITSDTLYYSFTPNGRPEGSRYADGILPDRPVNSETGDGNFVVLAHEEKVKIINGGGTFNDGRYYVQVQRGGTGEFISVSDGSITSGDLITPAIPNGLSATDKVRVAVRNANGNRTQFSEAVTVVNGPTNLSGISIIAGNTGYQVTADTITATTTSGTLGLWLNNEAIYVGTVNSGNYTASSDTITHAQYQAGLSPRYFMRDNNGNTSLLSAADGTIVGVTRVTMGSAQINAGSSDTITFSFSGNVNVSAISGSSFITWGGTDAPGSSTSIDVIATNTVTQLGITVIPADDPIVRGTTTIVDIDESVLNSITAVDGGNVIKFTTGATITTP